MLSIFFFPGRLDPVLDGGPGDEDAVVTPQVPPRRLIGQAILGDEADGQFLHAASVLALGPGQVRQGGGEVEVAVGAVVPGEGNGKIDGAVTPQVAEVVQHSSGGGVAAGAGTAARTAAGRVVAAALFDPRLGEFLDTGNPLGSVGDIFTGSVHG